MSPSRRNAHPNLKRQGLIAITLLVMLFLPQCILADLPCSAIASKTTPFVMATVANASLTQTYPNANLCIEENRGELLESLASSFGLNTSSLVPSDGGVYLRVDDFRRPSFQNDLDSYFNNGYTLYDQKSAETEIWLYYTSSGSLTNYVVALTHSGIVASNMTMSCLENTTRNVASLLGVPLQHNLVISTISLYYANLTAVMLSEEADGFALAGCNIFVCIYDVNRSLVVVQCRSFFSIPSTMEKSPQDALLVGRNESPKKFLDPSHDIILMDEIAGIRLCPIDHYSYSGSGNNTTVNEETQFRLGYEYVANVQSTSPGIEVNYSVLVAVDVDTGEALVTGRSPIPVPAHGFTQPFLELWQIGLMVFITFLSLFFILSLVFLSPEVAFGVTGSLALVAMRLKGTGILDNFTRGRI